MANPLAALATKDGEARLAPWLAFGLALLAAALRLPVALRESLWHDECLTRQVALLPWGDWWSGYVATESSPPLYFFLARLFAALSGWGDAPPAWLLPLRLPSLMAASLAPAILFLGTWRRLGLVPAFGGAFPLAISPWLIWHGAEARPYALWTFALTGLLVATLDLAAPLEPTSTETERRGAFRWTAWALAALATHYFAALPVALAMALWGGRIALDRQAGGAGDQRPWTPWLASLCALLAALAALGLLFRAQVAGGHTEYIAPAPLKDLGRTFLVVFPFGLDAALGKPLRLLGAAAMAAIVVASVWRGTAALALWRRDRCEAGARDAATEGVALAWLVLPTLGLFAISKLVRPVYLYDRYPIMGLPALALLAALALRDAASPGGERRTAARRLLGAFAVGGLVACASWQAARYAFPERGTLREDWLSLPEHLAEAGLDVEEVAAWWTPDELVVEPFRHNAAPTMRNDAAVSRSLDEALDDGGPGGANAARAAFLARPATLEASAADLAERGLAARERWRGDDLAAGWLEPLAGSRAREPSQDASPI